MKKQPELQWMQGFRKRLDQAGYQSEGPPFGQRDRCVFVTLDDHDGCAGPSAAVRGGGWVGAASLALTSVLARPAWYRIPQALPFLGIGRTIYDPGFDSAVPFHYWQERLGTRLLPDLEQMQSRRAVHARRLAAVVSDTPRWTVPAGRAMRCGPIRLPLLAPDAPAREAAVDALRGRGIAAGPMYPGALHEIPELRPHLAGMPNEFPGARELVRRLLTLPVYPTLGEKDLCGIAQALSAATSVVR